MKVYPALETERRRLGLFLIGLGLFFSGPYFISFCVENNFIDSWAASGNGTISVFFGLALIICGVYFRLVTKRYIHIDRTAGLLIIYQAGSKLRDVTFADAGPLKLISEIRTIYTKNSSQKVKYYCVEAPFLFDDFLYDSTSEKNSFRAGVRYARLLAIPLIDHNGHKLFPEELSNAEGLPNA